MTAHRVSFPDRRVIQVGNAPYRRTRRPHGSLPERRIRHGRDGIRALQRGDLPQRYGPQRLAGGRGGFTTAWISDHYHPWIDEQGQSPFVWSVIGGIAATTERIRLGTGVTCPTIRIHPAIIAQATATSDRKSTRLNSSHANISYAVFCL